MAEKTGDTRERLLTTALELIWSNSYSSVSVDDICAAADAKKGSFYHYFKSKADLLISAFEKSWSDLRVELDRFFSPSIPPLERLKTYSAFSIEQHKEICAKTNHVVGCPFTSLGSEQCCREDGVREKANELMLRFRRYFVSAVRDAADEGSISTSDPEKLADQLYSYYIGAYAQARLADSLEPLDLIWPAWANMLGLIEESREDEQAA